VDIDTTTGYGVYGSQQFFCACAFEQITGHSAAEGLEQAIEIEQGAHQYDLYFGMTGAERLKRVTHNSNPWGIDKHYIGRLQVDHAQGGVPGNGGDYNNATVLSKSGFQTIANVFLPVNQGNTYHTEPPSGFDSAQFSACSLCKLQNVYGA
jgi:hypothetical protein